MKETLNEQFINKIGKAIQLIASDIYMCEVGDKLLSISEFQAKYDLARGTVQNSLAYLRDNHIIQTQSKGFQGTILTEVNKNQLRQLLVGNGISGTMPLPYSKLYEGFATALYTTFQENDLDLHMAYIRGSSVRVEAIQEGKFDFSVLSEFAYEDAIVKGVPIKKIINFGDNSYLSKHVVVYRENIDQPYDGIRVGIDYNSLDHVYLTREFSKGIDITEVPIPSNQLVYALRENQIDVGIWNYDEIIDKKIDDLYYRFIQPTEETQKMSQLVIVCHSDNQIIESIIMELINIRTFNKIQDDVKTGKMTPRY